MRSDGVYEHHRRAASTGKCAGAQAPTGGARRRQIWGTRLRVEDAGWEETMPSLRNMVAGWRRQLRPVARTDGWRQARFRS